eukprot:6197859-Pleurochrysis_carterae.AAC.3
MGACPNLQKQLLLSRARNMPLNILLNTALKMALDQMREAPKRSRPIDGLHASRIAPRRLAMQIAQTPPPQQERVKGQIL